MKDDIILALEDMGYVYRGSGTILGRMHINFEKEDGRAFSDREVDEVYDIASMYANVDVYLVHEEVAYAYGVSADAMVDVTIF
tara:strand:- start:22 stop:270 length:249 start_codon:yes stop_codon:yes gene_type:complete